MLVFISYSRIDKDFAQKIATDLKSKNIPIWMDVVDIAPGSRWDREIENALEKSTHFLLIMSKSSANSENVRDEVDFALDSGKVIVPLKIDDCIPPLRIRRVQWTDVAIGYEAALDKITERLLNQEASPNRAAEKAPPAPTPTERQTAYKLLWEKLKDVELELRSEKSTMQKYESAVRTVNEFILGSALYLDDEDYELANQYMTYLKQVEELVKKYSDEIPQLRRGWHSTEKIIPKAIQQFETEEQQIVNQMNETRNQILTKCKSIVTG